MGGQWNRLMQMLPVSPPVGVNGAQLIAVFKHDTRVVPAFNQCLHLSRAVSSPFLDLVSNGRRLQHGDSKQLPKLKQW